MVDIPIVSDAIGIIKWSVDFFVDKIPRPIKFLIFLVLLIFFVSIISFLLHLTGIHCNAEKEIVKTDLLDVADNIEVIFIKDKTYIDLVMNVTQLYPKKQPTDCYYYAKVNDSGFVECDEGDITCNYYLKGGSCHDCTYKEYCTSGTFLGICGDWEYLCNSDAGYREEALGDITCTGVCNPPPYYEFSFDDGMFHCLNESLCGVEQQELLNLRLKEMDAQPLYTNIDDNDYRRFVTLSCDENYNPTFTLYGLPIFDYQIWILIMLLYIMVMLLFKLKTSQ